MRLVAALCLVAPVSTLPAAAQSRAEVAAATIDTINAVAGAYGDEAAAIDAAIDRVSARVAAWDERIGRAEAGFAGEVARAPDAAAAGMRAALGSVYFDRGRFADAARELELSTRADPSASAAHLLRALSQEALGQPSAAASRAAWRAAPRDPAAAYQMLRTRDAAADDGSVAAALGVLIDAARRADMPGPLFPTANLFAGEGERDIVFVPQPYATAFARLRESRFAEAIADLRRSLASDPLRTDVAATSAGIAAGIRAFRDGDVSSAVTAFTAAATGLRTSSEAYRLLGAALGDAGRLDEAQRALQRATELNPLNERADLMLADLLVDAERGDDAEAVLRRTVERLPQSGHAWLRLARIHRAQQRDGEALRDFERAAAIGPVLGAASLQGAIAQLRLVALDLDGAVTANQARAALEPNAMAAHRELGDAYRRVGRLDDALAECAVAVLLDPGDAGAQAVLGQVLLARGQQEAAILAFRRAVAIEPALKEAHYGLVAAYRVIDRPEDAARELQTFQELQARSLQAERDTFALNELKLAARLRSRTGEPAQAAALWQTIAEREPTVRNLMLLAQTRVAARDLAGAATAYERAAQLGAPPLVYRRLAELYVPLGRADDSELAMRTFERLNTNRLRARGARR